MKRPSFLKKILSGENKFNEGDLVKATAEYVEAANELNAIDFGDEKQGDEKARKAVMRYKTASKKYQEIYRERNPEVFKDETEDNKITILPHVNVTNAGIPMELLADLGTKEDKPLKRKK